LVYNSVAALLAGRPIRFPGVLQRIALSSFVSAVQPFWTWLFPFVAVVVWWYSSIKYYDPDCFRQHSVGKGVFSPARCTAQSRIDFSVFGAHHMYSPSYDPEGLLSTVTTAAVTVCAGTYLPTLSNVGTLMSTYLLPLQQKYCISSPTRSRLIFYSVIAFASCILIYPLPLLFPLPLSKPLWTPPFLLQTIGISLLSWLLASLVDVYPSLKISPLEAMGRRSLEVYLAAEILQEFAMYPGKRTSGSLWEGIVKLVMDFGVSRRWGCLLLSTVWAGVFAAFGWILDRYEWRIKL
jgi:predicted acyltransferase